MLAFFIALALWLGVRGPGDDLVGVDKSSTMSRVPGLGMAFADFNCSIYYYKHIFLLKMNAPCCRKYDRNKFGHMNVSWKVNLFFTNLNWANLKERTYDLGGLLSIKLTTVTPKCLFIILFVIVHLSIK